MAAASLASIPRCTRFECALPVVLGEALKAVHERVSNTMQAYCDIGDDESYKIWKEARLIINNAFTKTVIMRVARAAIKTLP